MIEIEESLKEKLEKTSNMFQYAPHVNAKTKKRSQKENRRKAKRRKVSRKAANIQKVREFISNASASEVIQIQNLKWKLYLHYHCVKWNIYNLCMKIDNYLLKL